MKTQLRLLRYVWPHWRGLVVLLSMMVLKVGLEVLRPWPTKLIVDQVLEHHPVPPRLMPVLAFLPGPRGLEGLLMWACASTVLVFLISNVSSKWGTFASVKLGQQVTYDLGADLFLHLQRLSLLFHTQRRVGDLISRVTGDSYCVQDLVSTLMSLLQALCTLGAVFGVMWRLNAKLTLLSLAVAPFMVLCIRIYGKPMKMYSRQRRDLEGRLMSIVQQTLNALPAVQAFTREEVEHSRYRHKADETVAAYLRATKAQYEFNKWVGLLTALGTAGIMWIGGRYALEGTMTTGTILVFLSYLGSIYGPLNSIAYTASTLQYATSGADRVMEILDTPLDVKDLPGAREAHVRGSIRYEDVTFGYEPSRSVIHGASFEVGEGEVVAIVGPTGEGKSTLVNLLVRFFDPWSGRVMVDGEDIRNFRVRSLRQQVAIVLQEPFIFRLTVAENIAYGRPDATRSEIEAAAKAASADDFIRRLPEGYDTIIGERGATLSGGEKQRLSIARAFLKDAPILVLDEPTSALDALTESALLETLELLMKGRTTFIIAHRLSTIRNADRILVVNRGRIAEEGAHPELLARNGLYANLYRQQISSGRWEVVLNA